MFGLLKDVYQRIENIRGKNLVITLSVIFVVFTVIGIIFGYSMQAGLTEDEIDESGNTQTPSSRIKRISLYGRIEYVNPNVYGGVTHVLVDESGEDVLLLEAEDEKLSISEGLFATVSGVLTSAPENSDHGLDTMYVEEVTISNASD